MPGLDLFAHCSLAKDLGLSLLLILELMKGLVLPLIVYLLGSFGPLDSHDGNVQDPDSLSTTQHVDTMSVFKS